MIHAMLSISTLVLMLNMIAYTDQTLQKEVITAENNDELIIMINDKARDLCKRTVECWHKGGLEYNDAALDELLDPQVALVDYATLLNGLKSCLNEHWVPTTEQELALKDAVQKEHDLVQHEYENFIAQMGTRRIKIKYYAKVVTDELVVGNTATINSLIINNCIQLPNLPVGVLQITDGCLTTSVIPPFEITPGSITTAQLADGAVTTPKIADAPNGVTSAKINTQTVTGAAVGASGNIELATITHDNIVAGTITTPTIADGTITGGVSGNIAANTITSTNVQAASLTPETLSFHTLKTVSAENPLLLVYRGRIDSSGSIVSGAGFTVNHPSTGVYTITLATAYASATDYCVIVQPPYIGSYSGFANLGGAFQVVRTSGTVFTITFYTGTNGSTLVNPVNPFSFFTIGAT